MSNTLANRSDSSCKSVYTNNRTYKLEPARHARLVVETYANFELINLDYHND